MYIDAYQVWLPGAMVARLASIADGTKRLQVRVLRWSYCSFALASQFRELRDEVHALFRNHCARPNHSSRICEYVYIVGYLIVHGPGYPILLPTNSRLAHSEWSAFLMNEAWVCYYANTLAVVYYGENKYSSSSL